MVQNGYTKMENGSSSNVMDTSRHFLHKPVEGWPHEDSQLHPTQGIVFGVRYIGCMEVKQSMKSLDFDTRTQVAKESISRVCDAAGLKTATKKNKRGAKIHKLLGDEPSMLFAGTNVNLTITTESLVIMNMETGELIGNHQMPGISFASGGDPDTMEFVAYVAKDETFGRACHVLECGGGLAQDVITTIGQSFELRFKQYLANRPEAVALPDRLENPVFGSNGDAWGEDDKDDYYNDRLGARPPSPPHYQTPPCNLPVSDGFYNSVKDPKKKEAGFENNFVYDNSKGAAGADGDDPNIYDNKQQPNMQVYDNPSNNTPVLPQSALFDDNIYDNKDEGDGGASAGSAMPAPPPVPPPYMATPTVIPPLPAYSATDVSSLQHPGHDAAAVSMAAASGPLLTNGDASPPKPADPFDMTPFCQSLPGGVKPPSENDVSKVETSIITQSSGDPRVEPWFHGKISRQVVETMLLADGDFLVRESANSPGQFVLSGKQQGRVKHLLLVDPEGVVRTKDRTFDSISHLLKYHMESGHPITSNDSELVLKAPIMHSSG